MTETLEDLRRKLHAMDIDLRAGLISERGYGNHRGRIIAKIEKLKNQTKPQTKAA